jgi:hypothetical protein
MPAKQSNRQPAASPTPLLPPPVPFPVFCLHAASALHRTLAAVFVFAPALAAAVGMCAYWVVDGSSWETLLPAQAIARAASDWDRLFFTVAISEVGVRSHRLQLCDMNQVLILPLHLSVILRPARSVPRSALVVLYASIASSSLAFM